MRKHLLGAGVALSLPCALLGCDQHAADREKIESVFHLLDSCNDRGDGDGVLVVYSQDSFDYYDSLLPIILDGTPEQVRSLLPDYRYEVLLARLMGTRAELTGLDGREYTRHATRNGWYRIPPDQRTNDTLGRFDFIGMDEAWAEVMTDDEASGFVLCFFRVGDEWKLDEPRMYDRNARLWEEAADVEGVTIDEYLVMYLEYTTERQVPATIWEPMPQ